MTDNFAEVLIARLQQCLVEHPEDTQETTQRP